MCGSNKFYHASDGTCTSSSTTNGSGNSGNDAFKTTDGAANPSGRYDNSWLEDYEVKGF